MKAEDKWIIAPLSSHKEELAELEALIKNMKNRQTASVMTALYYTMAIAVTGLLTVVIPSNITRTTSFIVSTTLVSLFSTVGLAMWNISIGLSPQKKTIAAVISVYVVTIAVTKMITCGVSPNITTIISPFVPSLLIYPFCACNLLTWIITSIEICSRYQTLPLLGTTETVLMKLCPERKKLRRQILELVRQETGTNVVRLGFMSLFYLAQFTSVSYVRSLRNSMLHGSDQVTEFDLNFLEFASLSFFLFQLVVVIYAVGNKFIIMRDAEFLSEHLKNE